GACHRMTAIAVRRWRGGESVRVLRRTRRLDAVRRAVRVIGVNVAAWVVPPREVHVSVPLLDDPRPVDRPAGRLDREGEEVIELDPQYPGSGLGGGAGAHRAVHLDDGGDELRAAGSERGDPRPGVLLGPVVLPR